MKKEALLVVLFLSILIFQVVAISAETTFFEGDDYRGDFIMANLPEEIVAQIEEGETEILRTGGGSYFLRETYNSTEVCDVCFDSLRQQIQDKQSIDYEEEEIILLASEINQQYKTDLSNSQVRYIIENFEDECDAPYPLLGGIAGGRFRDILSPFTIAIAVIILIFVIFIGYRIISTLRKVKIKKTKKKKKIKKKSKKKKKK